MGASARSGSDGGSRASARGGSDDCADSRAHGDLADVVSLRGDAFTNKASGADWDLLAVRSGDAGERERHARDAFDAACLVEFDDLAEHSRACFRDDPAIDDEFTVERRGKCITCKIAVGGEALGEAHLDESACWQSNGL